MTDTTFSVGDVVVLKSDGPKMTIEKIDSDQCHCVWFENDNTEKRSAFSFKLLDPAEPDISIMDLNAE